MRYSIFQYGEDITDIVFVGETPNKAFFKVKGELVSLACNGKYTYIESCTCKHCSTHMAVAELRNNIQLCKRKIALIKWLKYKNVFSQKRERE